MALWSDWSADVAIDVPGCPDPTIELAVRRIVIDFLERTHWLARTAAPIDIAAGAAARTFGTPLISVSSERVLRIQAAWISDRDTDILSPDEVAETMPDWKTRTGTPLYIVQERPDEYWVVPAPTATMTGALRLKIAVAPTETATGCEDVVRAHWRDAIASGAKARLLAMPGKPWSNPGLAAYHLGVYEEAVGSGAIGALRSPARGRLATKPYFF